MTTLQPQPRRARVSKLHRPAYLAHIILAIISILCMIPIVLMASASFTDEDVLSANGYRLFPPKFSTSAYEYLFTDLSQIVRSFAVTVSVTAIGTGLGLLVMGMCAYALSRRTFRFRSVVGFVIFFTLLFNGGLISSYILITQYL
ncbi:MAG: carbohydrate ABC transporter permease, partial [Chloroflexota bacterium]|nr:carbohydrate ABC transporter permease [Chloroflexota bacterium]